MFGGNVFSTLADTLVAVADYRPQAIPDRSAALVNGHVPETIGASGGGMIATQSKLLFQLNKFYQERVHARKANISKTIREICKVVQDVLKEVEVQEPRFISSLSEENGRYSGIEVVTPTEFDVVLYLNQMGVFNFVDDGNIPGCSVLKAEAMDGNAPCPFG